MRDIKNITILILSTLSIAFFSSCGGGGDDGGGSDKQSPTWAKTYGGTNFDQGYSVQQTSDGGHIVAGTTLSFDFNYGDVYLIKTDPNGTIY